MRKKYIVRVNCIGFEDIEVEAKNKREAQEIAEMQFSCRGSEGESYLEDVEEVKPPKKRPQKTKQKDR